ncbi:MAG: hypothetical protein SGILL_005884 [Bacillariaceae sp.]
MALGKTPPTKASQDDTLGKEMRMESSTPMTAASPDYSIPSATETSYASSPDDESKALPTRRTLFKMEDDKEEERNKVMTLAESTKVRPSPSKVSPSKYETVLVSAKSAVRSETSSIVSSTTSSDTTAIPSWNLSVKGPEEATELDETMEKFTLSPETPENVRSPPSPLGWKKRYHTLKGNFMAARLSKDPGLVFEEARPFYASREETNTEAPSIGQHRGKASPYSPEMEEVPPEPMASCSSALNLTPTQLAEIFLAFGQTVRERSPHSDHDDAASAAAVASSPRSDNTTDGKEDGNRTPPSSPKKNDVGDNSKEALTPQSRYLARENKAFKKIVEQDAHTILNLQRALETQKQLCALKEVEIMDRHTELQISDDRISRLKKEREEKLEKETELLETIRILKLEVDKMTLGSGALVERTKMLDLEADLQSQRTRISELESTVKEKDAINFNLQTDIDYLKSQQLQQGDGHVSFAPSLEASKKAEGDDSSHMVVPAAKNSTQRGPPSLANVLENISHRLELLEKQKEDKEAKEDVMTEQMREIQSLLKIETDESMVLKVKNNPEEIEAIPLADKSKGSLAEETQYTYCCGWGVVAAED